jgi:hypothetical protein
MKSSLWIVIVLVTGIVGFLVGYSVSSSTGGMPVKAKEAAHKEQAAGYAAEPAAAKGAAAPAPAAGYGAQPAAAKAVSTGGYK